MESVWNRVCYYSSATWTELVFWGDVMVDFLGLDKSKFHTIVEAREREIKVEEREEDIQIRRKTLKRPVIYYD